MALNERIIIKRWKNRFYLISANDEYNDFTSDLAEAKERANDENTSADDFIQFLRGSIR